MKIITCDKEWEKMVFSKIKKIILNSLKHSKKCSLILTGGESVQKLYKHWARQKIINNELINYYYGDERCVSETSKFSNYKMTKDKLFYAADYKKLKIHKIIGKPKSVHGEIKRYSKKIPKNPDLTLLSLGYDGHIASIFPNDESIFEKKRKLAYIKKNNSKQYRFTITPKVIKQSKNVFIFCIGKDKGYILKKMLNNKNEISMFPAMIANNAIYFLDQEAAMVLN